MKTACGLALPLLFSLLASPALAEIDLTKAPREVSGVAPGMTLEEVETALNARGMVRLDGKNIEVEGAGVGVFATSYAYGNPANGDLIHVEAAQTEMAPVYRVSAFFPLGAASPLTPEIIANFGQPACDDSDFRYDAEWQSADRANCAVELSNPTKGMPQAALNYLSAPDAPRYTAIFGAVQPELGLFSLQDNRLAAELQTSDLAPEAAEATPAYDVQSAPGIALQGVAPGMGWSEAAPMLEERGFKRSKRVEAFKLRAGLGVSQTLTKVDFHKTPGGDQPNQLVSLYLRDDGIIWQVYFGISFPVNGPYGNPDDIKRLVRERVANVTPRQSKWDGEPRKSGDSGLYVLNFDMSPRADGDHANVYDVWKHIVEDRADLPRSDYLTLRVDVSENNAGVRWAKLVSRNTQLLVSHMVREHDRLIAIEPEQKSVDF
ncbi:hypothetical protein ATO6_08275 [Oceanicola sp. 22II-s10i]|uniref:hypothetical protein n=1 Tax=Oceanicola sp. 22II-s10i TaxID=1317116 RepID=UPI000B5268CF|nr:hypothetical protein [Oceanicola sp. 22II-s10i]OWU85042.1 hypothetical protein ATO6_08275 [Oceanicola sp. 22II-s10i]